MRCEVRGVRCVGVTPSAADEWLCHECLAALPDADMEVLPEE